MKIICALSLLTLFPASALATAPQVKTQAPGYYRTLVGDFEVTALLDGFFPMKAKEMLLQVPEAKLHEYLAQSFQGDTIPTSDNAFLINTGTRLILIDSGCGAFFGPSFGHVLENLKAAGYTPDQVDEIEITHMHADHLGGIVADGKAVFPHAVLRMDQKDSDYWLNPGNAQGVSGDMMKSMFGYAVASVAPYKAAGQFKPFQGETELAPGIKAIPSYGHTPGHTSYSIESKGQKLLLIGDLVHLEAVEFPDPSSSFLGDSDKTLAVAARKKAFREASERGYEIGAAHLPFPGLGHVLKQKSGYRFVPAPYAPIELPK